MGIISELKVTNHCRRLIDYSGRERIRDRYVHVAGHLHSSTTHQHCASEQSQADSAQTESWRPDLRRPLPSVAGHKLINTLRSGTLRAHLRLPHAKLGHLPLQQERPHSYQAARPPTSPRKMTRSTRLSCPSMCANEALSVVHTTLLARKSCTAWKMSSSAVPRLFKPVNIPHLSTYQRLHR